MQFHEDDLHSETLAVLDVHYVFAYRDARGGGSREGGVEVVMVHVRGHVEGEVFCCQGGEEHDEAAVRGAGAVEQLFAPCGDFFAAAQGRFEGRGAVGLLARLVVQFAQGLHYRVEAAAGGAWGSVRRQVEGLFLFLFTFLLLVDGGGIHGWEVIADELV